MEPRGLAVTLGFKNKRLKIMIKDLEKVNSIITRSGNSFHCKVLKYLKDKGWAVLISPYYNDNISSKPREIDLIAEKSFSCIYDHFGRASGTVNVKLYIECKHISQKTVFWFYDKNKDSAIDLVTQSTPMTKDNFYTKKHHYLEGEDRVAKLFADERSNSSETEVFYKALNQSLNAMIYHRGKGTIINLPNSRKGFIKAIADYPVIVCNSFDNLFRVEIDTDAEPIKINDNFQLEVNYAYMNSIGKNADEYFLIDIIKFELLDKYLEKMESDAKLFNVFLSE